MDMNGYMVRVSFDGDVLTAEGTNKAAQVALRGQDRLEGPVVVPVADVAAVEHKAASMMTNGRVTVHTVDGRRYVLHFRRKDADDFARLAAALGATV